MACGDFTLFPHFFLLAFFIILDRGEYMNDLFIENMTNNQDPSTQKDSRIELEFLDEFGDGKTQDDEIVKNLIFTCEEGFDYTQI